MKLFSDKDRIGTNFSMEEFRGHYNSARVISTESITDYFYKVKEIFLKIPTKIILT